MENLIFDRTQSDLENGTSKSYYNCTDLNRVETWCKYLADTLNSYSYKVNIITKTDWNMSDFPTKLELERIRNNIKALKDVYFSFTNIPFDLNFMTIYKANDIEKILSEIDFLTKNMISCFRYSNTFNAGESEGLI